MTEITSIGQTNDCQQNSNGATSSRYLGAVLARFGYLGPADLLDPQLPQVYRDVVNSSYKYEDVVPSSEGYSFDDEHSKPPFYAAKSDIGGRGLFASRLIKKGEKVHDGPRSSVEFPSSYAYRNYIFSLTRNRACDMLAWAWTQFAPGLSRKAVIYTAFDISILMNNGNSDKKNVGPKTISDQKKEILYALRDIQKDEEILNDYGKYDATWSDVGL